MYASLESTINDVVYKIVKKGIFDNKGEIDNILGVLSNNGVYAMWVYVKSKKKEANKEKNLGEEEKDLMKELRPLFEKVFPDKFNGQNNNDYENEYEKFFREIAENLPTLIFVKDILERTLTYIRYHVKALDVKALED